MQRDMRWGRAKGNESKAACVWCSVLFACFCLAAAPDDRGSLSLMVPEALHVDDHVTLTLTLALPAGARGPLLVTPRSQGGALEVVRGRLLRSDARDASANPLVFELPVLARSAGQAVVSVRALVVRCADGRCEPLTLETRKSVLVLPRP
jgi:hypothetical protein